MKRYIFLVFVLLMVFNFTGCKNEKTIKEISLSPSYENDISEEEREAYYNTLENFEKTFTSIRVQEKNYIIKSSDDYAGDFYEIYDNDGNLLDKGYHGWRGSFDISKEKSIVTLQYGFGGTNVYPQYRLYDVEKSKVSRYFKGPIAVKDTLIAYFNVGEENATLVVQDIFDVDKTYQEFKGKFDEFISMKMPEISFSEDGTKVSIKYCETDNESNIIEEVFVLD